MKETLYGSADEAIHKITNDRLRDYIAHVLGPSPFDFRGRHILSREQARQIADDVVDAMEKSPDKASAILKAIYGAEDEE